MSRGRFGPTKPCLMACPIRALRPMEACAVRDTLLSTPDPLPGQPCRRCSLLRRWSRGGQHALLCGGQRNLGQERPVAESNASERRAEAPKRIGTLLRNLVDLCPDAMGVLVEGEIVLLNAAGARLFGAPSPEDLIGRRGV